MLSLLACARIEPPPGGPPDTDPPRIIATAPDSLARLPDFDGEVEFRFDEVVSEGGAASQGTGTGDLERLVVLSPSTRVPEVRWRRSRITVRPDEGWQPGRVYRVELLPGVTDLRRNRSGQGAIVTFTTGAAVPDSRLEGLVVDWTTSRPAANALVVATLLPDSLPYRAVTDSVGRFALGPLPAGEYIVSGVIDQNRNRRADGREAFDTARVRAARGPAAVGELWTFVHDTVPPRITTITSRDSLSATIELSQPLAPALRPKPADATVVLLPDSTPVPVLSLLPKPLDDSLNAPAPKPDTTAAAPGARPGAPAQRRAAPAAPPRAVKVATRPPLSNQLVLRVRRQWSPGSTYVVTLRGLRNITGVTGEARGTLAVPAKPAATDSAAAVPDSAAPPAR
ncbi:MAG TPA: Ig-like domain-containing protein [Gemmatimonadales bacterium]|nr:Ig-like domain-containing protein [Gemmatimonadales bacterium]